MLRATTAASVLLALCSPAFSGAPQVPSPTTPAPQTKPAPAPVPPAAQSPAVPEQEGGEPDDTPLEIAANLVTITVVVRDSAGNVVSDLKADDFTVYEDGKAQ